MAEHTKIEWATHTWSPWVGCAKVSPACDHCYAESWAKRTGHPELWDGERRRTSGAYWAKLARWNQAAKLAGRIDTVFPSLCDPFDNQVPPLWRDDMWHAIDRCPHLVFLLLTKRPQNIAKMLPTAEIGARPWAEGWPNVWLGTTVENQEEADRRIPHVLAVPARRRFLSCEPLLSSVELIGLRQHLDQWNNWRDGGGIHWVIAGGESGPGARPMNPQWARSLRDQCDAAGVPFLFKQWGEWAPADWLAAGLDRHGFDTQYPFRTDEFFAGPKMIRVGKKLAGRFLDGALHDAAPPMEVHHAEPA